MAAGDIGPPDPRGDALVAELKWVHDMIRRDLATVRQMAADAAAGLPGRGVASAVRTLAASSPLLEHLRYEEEQISATLRTWSGWPHW
jgi:hypothetical protein